MSDETLMQEIALRDMTIEFLEEENMKLNLELEALRAENAQKRDALIGTLAALVAAVSLLEHGGKKAMPSDKMFEQMLSDFNETIRAARAAMGETE